MTSRWDAYHFLAFLNSSACVEDGNVRPRTDEERAQESSPLNTAKQFVYTQEVGS